MGWLRMNKCCLKSAILLSQCSATRLLLQYIVGEGEPTDAVFLITDGIAWSYLSSNNVEGRHGASITQRKMKFVVQENFRIEQ